MITTVAILKVPVGNGMGQLSYSCTPADKKRVYEQAVVERRGNFTPIVLSVDGLLHREAEHFLKRMAANLAHKWEKPYSQTCGYVRARLAFSIIRATRLCLRGSRVKWRSGLGMDDGAHLYSIL